MKYVHATLMTNGDMSGNLESNGEDLNQIFMFSIQAIFPGSPVGSLKLQVSNDSVPVSPVATNPSNNVVNWVDYTQSITPVSSAGNFMWIVSDSGYRWVRLVYTAISGTGQLTVSYSGKG